MKGGKQKNIIYDWQREAGRYFGYTPHPKQWFEFLGWVTALSTLNFLSNRTHSVFINVLYFFSYVVFFNYIERAIWAAEFQKYIPVKLSKGWLKIFTYTISALLVALTHLIIFRIQMDLGAGLGVSS